MKLYKVAAAYALGRAAMNQVKELRRPKRSVGAGTAILAVAGGVAAYFIARELWLRRGEEAPAWPSRKKLEKDARQREARMRAQAAENHPPPKVTVQRDATTELKTTLGDVAGDGLRR